MTRRHAVLAAVVLALAVALPLAAAASLYQAQLGATPPVVLRKPLRPSELVRTVERLLAREPQLTRSASV